MARQRILSPQKDLVPSQRIVGEKSARFANLPRVHVFLAVTQVAMPTSMLAVPSKRTTSWESRLHP